MLLGAGSPVKVRRCRVIRAQRDVEGMRPAIDLFPIYSLIFIANLPHKTSSKQEMVGKWC